MELLQGYVQPEVPAGTQAAVFAVYEQGRSLQYIGFSKDLRNSLRTLFGRRPDKAHFYRHVATGSCLWEVSPETVLFGS